MAIFCLATSLADLKERLAASSSATRATPPVRAATCKACTARWRCC
jgi:formyltetrahydrofolate synthetase